MSSSSVDDVRNFLDRNLSVIIGFVSSFVLTILLQGPQRVEVRLIVILVVLISIGVVGPLRTWINNSPVMRENQRWRDVLLVFINSLLSLGIFLAVQLVLVGFRASIGTGEPSGVELIAFVIIALLSVFGIFDTLKAVLTPVR